MPAPTMEDLWRIQARVAHQNYYEDQGPKPWILIEPDNWLKLALEVGNEILGPPLQPRTEANLKTGYSSEELRCIVPICDQLLKPFKFDVEGILYSRILVFVRVNNDFSGFPIFKARAVSSDSTIFVDTLSRTYKSWEDWRRHEKLPKGSYSAPLRGFYEVAADGLVELIFEDTNACGAFEVARNISRIFCPLDVAFGPIIRAIFPVTGPVTRLVSRLCNVVSVADNAYELYDRATHSQSIGLRNEEARKCWLSLFRHTVGPAADILHDRFQAYVDACKTAGQPVDPKLEKMANMAKYVGISVIFLDEISKL